MTLVYDVAQAGQPGTHALIIGVSAYTYLPGGAKEQPEPESFGMRQLTSAAASAFKVYEWLMANGASLVPPLASCRLLLSPSPGEAAGAPAVLRATTKEVIAAINAWRAAARADRDGATLFYFAGHGIQRGDRDAVILLEDWNELTYGGRLRNSIDTLTLFDGMSPTQVGNAEIARTQIYCVDACRLEPEEFAKLRSQSTDQCFALTAGALGVADRSAPFLYGALPGAAAEALPEKQTLFSLALLRALDTAIDDDADLSTGQPRWPVTVRKLIEAMDYEIEQLRRKYGGDFDFSAEGQNRDAVLRYLGQRPEVEVTIQVEPPVAAGNGSVQILDEEDQPFQPPLGPPVKPHPARIKLPVGLYSVVVDFNPPAPPYRTSRRVKEARRGSVWQVKVV